MNRFWTDEEEPELDLIERLNSFANLGLEVFFSKSGLRVAKTPRHVKERKTKHMNRVKKYIISNGLCRDCYQLGIENTNTPLSDGTYRYCFEHDPDFSA